MMKTITVKGVGSVSVKPDLIVISMNLETKNKDYEKTMDYAAQRIDLLNDALEEIGFEKKSVKTTDFHVRTQYESVKDKDGTYKRVFDGYVCAHSLKVEFDFDTKRLAKVLSAIAACFASPELSVAFTVKDSSAVSEELLKSAAKNAVKKAETLCQASGAKLGELISIDYSWGEINVYSDTGYGVERSCMMKADACLSDIDIEPDDVKVRDTVTFVWEIL